MRSALSSALWITVFLVACGHPRPPGTAQHGILVIAVDGLRADHLGSYGYDRDTSPSLDELARDGVQFLQAFSTAPWILPSHVSLLTGCDPNLARRRLPPGLPPALVTTWNIPGEVPRLSKELLRRGYSTAAFPDDPTIAAVYGFAAGFETFLDCKITAKTRPVDLGLPAAGRRFLDWLRGLDGGESWFAYLHVNDLERIWTHPDPQWDTFFEPRAGLSQVPPVTESMHAFHAIPRSKWSGGVRTLGEYEAQYDGAIRKLDEQIGRLFTSLRQARRWDHTTIAVVGTYGISFGESGLVLDHGLLSDVDLRIPLILRPAQPIATRRGLSTPALASTLDVAPTLLELSGFEIPRAMHGLSLLSIMRGSEEPVRAYALSSCGLRQGYTIVDERYCLEVTWPGLTDFGLLAQSWYGGPLPADPESDVWECLHDRQSNPFPGHQRAGSSPPEIAQELRNRAAEWIVSIERARALLEEVNIFSEPTGMEEQLDLLPAASPVENN